MSNMEEDEEWLGSDFLLFLVDAVVEYLALLGTQVLQNPKKYHGPHSHDILLDLLLLEGEFLQSLHNKLQLQVPMWYVELEGLRRI